MQLGRFSRTILPKRWLGGPASKKLPKPRRILLACMPKSGSTYLARVLTSIPGYRRGRLVPSYERREQEIEEARLLEMDRLIAELQQKSKSRRRRGYVAQHHVRYSRHTADMIASFDLMPVVLVRNIFDIVVSLRDHLEAENPNMAMAYVTEDMRAWPHERMYAFLADMAVPWYFNFYVSWQQCPNHLLVTYEQLREDPAGALNRIGTFARMNLSESKIERAIEQSAGRKTRFNKGISGRGDVLPESVKDTIRAYATHYPDVDFGPIGL